MEPNELVLHGACVYQRGFVFFVFVFFFVVVLFSWGSREEGNNADLSGHVADLSNPCDFLNVALKV